MLFQQLRISDRHAAVHGFARVVDGWQGEVNPIQINELASSSLPFYRTPDGLVGQQADRLFSRCPRGVYAQKSTRTKRRCRGRWWSKEERWGVLERIFGDRLINRKSY